MFLQIIVLKMKKVRQNNSKDALYWRVPEGLEIKNKKV